MNDPATPASAQAQETEFAQSIVQTLHEPLLVLRPDLAVQSVNPAFYTHFEVNPAETVGRKIYDLGNGQWDIPALRALLEDVLQDSNAFNDYEVTHNFEKLGRRVMLLNGRRLDDVQLILLGIRDITGQKRAQAELRESQERLSLAIEIGELASWDWDVRTGEVKWSDRHYLMQGCAVGEVTPSYEAWLARVHPEDRDDATALIERSRDERSLYIHEFRTQQPSGEIRWCSARGRFYYDDQGQPIRMVGVMEDVTDRKGAESALRESESKYRTLFEQIDEGFCIVEMIFEDERPVDYRFVEVNPAFERQTGIVNAEGRRMREIAPAHEEHWFEYCGDIARTGRARRFEAPAKALDGRWYDVNAFRVGEPDQLRVAILFNDITQRRHADAALRESEEKYRKLFETMGQGYAECELIRDASGQAVDYRFVELNPAFERLTGIPVAEARGRTNSEVLPGIQDWWVQTYDRIVRAGVPERVEYEAAPLGRWYEAYAYPKGGDRFITLYEEITDRKHAELELRDAKERQAFLLNLSDAMRGQTDPQAIKVQTVRMVFEHLRLDRCYISEVYEQDGYSTVGPEVVRPGLTPMTGTYQLADYPETMRQLATQPMVVHDSDNDPRFSDDEKELLALVPQRALLVAPLRKGPRAVVWALAAAMATPRRWTECERLLLEEVAERTWVAVERARSESALRESEARLRAVAANLPGGAAFLVDHDLRYTLAEGQGLRDAGFVPSDFEGKTLSEALPPNLAQEYEPRYRGALAGEPFKVEHAAHGRQFVTHGQPLRDASGRVTHALAVSYDITGLRRAEERLILALSAAQMGTWSWRVSTDLHHRDANLNRLLGIEDVETTTPIEHFFSHVHLEDRDRVKAVFEESVRHGHNMKADFRVVWPDGRVRWLSDQGDVFGTGDDRYLSGACVDITERKRLEQELRDADRRKDEFLAMLAHELRNPMAPIRTATEILKHVDGDTEQARPAVEMIERQVQHMVRLVDDLLDVSRVSRGKIELMREPMDLLSVIQPAIEIARPLCDSLDHELSVMLPSKPAYVNGDATRLTQVVGNLLNNACKFTEAGGNVWLSVERERNGNHAVIRVRDNGIGIAADQLKNIFELFSQVDTSRGRSRGGLGLGLTLVKNLVEMHEGTIEVHSAGVGQGSEFVIRLPLISAPQPQAEPKPAAPNTGSKSARRILVVDDNVEIAKGLSMMLKLSGHEIHIAHDGLAAVEAAEKMQPEVILLDLGLPGIDGYEAARRIRAQHREVRILLVALSGWGREEDRRLSKEAGFDAHLVKPPDVDALTKLLDTMSND